MRRTPSARTVRLDARPARRPSRGGLPAFFGVMTHLSEAILHELRIRIDRTLCVGFGDCVTLAPSLFALDEDGIAVFRCPDSLIEPGVILDACRACPVDALTVTDADGRQLAP